MSEVFWGCALVGFAIIAAGSIIATALRQSSVSITKVFNQIECESVDVKHYEGKAQAGEEGNQDGA